ncbi:MAG: hypothetical protein WDM77_13250 [Steroidobacteraceae bacterium]
MPGINTSVTHATWTVGIVAIQEFYRGGPGTNCVAFGLQHPPQSDHYRFVIVQEMHD